MANFGIYSPLQIFSLFFKEERFIKQTLNQDIIEFFSSGYNLKFKVYEIKNPF